MPSHDFHDPLDVRRSLSVDDLGDLTEILGAEQPRGDHAELPGVLRVEVREVMDVPARDEENITWSDTALLAIEDPGHDAGQPVDRLIEGVVAVRHRHAGTCRNNELEHRQASSGLRRFQLKSDLDLTSTDHIVSWSGIHHLHSCLPPETRHASRNTTSGFTRAARVAGNALAVSAAPQTSPALAASVIVSIGENRCVNLRNDGLVSDVETAIDDRERFSHFRLSDAQRWVREEVVPTDHRVEPFLPEELAERRHFR